MEGLLIQLSGVWKKIIQMEAATLVIICGLLLPFVGMEKSLFAAMILVAKSLLATFVMGPLWHHFGNREEWKKFVKDI